MTTDNSKTVPNNDDFQGVDKEPKKEKGHGEKVTMDDLKKKDVDADPAVEKKNEKITDKNNL